MKNLLRVLWAAATLVQCVAPASVVAGNVSPIQEGYVDANGVLIYYAELGHLPPLVVLHGGSGTSPDNSQREMWGSDGEFVIDGNLRSVEYLDRLSTIRVPTLIIAGDHDECDPVLAREMQEKIGGSKLVILPNSGHMAFETNLSYGSSKFVILLISSPDPCAQRTARIPQTFSARPR